MKEKEKLMHEKAEPYIGMNTETCPNCENSHMRRICGKCNGTGSIKVPYSQDQLQEKAKEKIIDWNDAWYIDKFYAWWSHNIKDDEMFRLGKKCPSVRQWKLEFVMSLHNKRWSDDKGDWI